MDFNWKEFEEQKIVVHCSTLEEEKDFLNECNKRGYKRYDGCLLEFDGYYYHCEKIKNICSGLYENYVCPHFKYNSCYCNHKIINWKINKEEKMEKVKVQELEKGKIYRFYNKDSNLFGGSYKINIDKNLMVVTDDGEESISHLLYNQVVNGYFVEIEKEIDWTKVPRGTKVQVRDSENQEWSNAYFSKILKSKNTDYPFRASFINDDEFTKLNLDDTSWGYKCCRIHKSVEIPEEWYKEVE